MIDKLKSRADLSKAALTCGLLGFFLLAALTGQLMAGAVQDANSGQYGQTLDMRTLPAKGKVTVVDCYSPYCPPCMRLAPMLEQLAQKRPDLVIKKVNIQRPEISGKIDWQSPVAKQLRLQSIPHFMIYNKHGKLASEGKEATNQVLGWLKEAGLLTQ